HQLIVGKDATPTNQPFIGVHRQQRVDTILRPQLIAPTALRRASAQPHCSDFTNLHKRKFLDEWSVTFSAARRFSSDTLRALRAMARCNETARRIRVRA